MMKRLWVFICAVMLLLGVVGSGFAVDEWKYVITEQTVDLVHWDNRANAQEIKEGISYYVNRAGFSDFGYYQFSPQFTGTYYLGLRFSHIWDDSGEIVNAYGEKISDWESQNLFLKVNLIAGETYYIGEDHHGESVFALCFPDKNIHPENDLFVNVRGASCTKPALQVSYCQYCGEIAAERETAPATGHTPGEWKIEKEATYTQEGLYAQRCAVCDEIIDSQAIEKTAHTPGAEETLRAANCIATGQTGSKCTQCGTVLTSTEVPMLPHVPGVWETTKPATCTGKGMRAQRCTVCNLTLNKEEAPALGHTPVAEETAATCISSGKRTTKCKVCMAALSTEELPMTEHTPGKWKDIDAATCTVCNITLATEELPALGHAPILQENAATCISLGEKRTSCSLCYETLSSEPLPLVDHTPIWETMWNAHCVSEGLRAQRCTYCGESLATEVIPAYGHSPMEWENVYEGTCLEPGSRMQCCNMCSKILALEDIPAKGHKWTEWVTDVEATKGHGGRMSRYCEHCGKEDIEILPQLEKVFGIF